MANYPHGAELSFKAESMDQRQAEARELLKAAGYGPENPLKFTYRYIESVDSRRVAIAVQGMWKEVGVDAQLLNTETRVHYNALRTQDFEVADAGWVADYNDPENFLFLMLSSSGQMNYSKYENKQYDALLDQAGHTMDVNQRAEIMRQAEQLILNDYPILTEYFATSRQLVKPYVKGFKDNVLKWHRTRYISLDKTSS
jgi:oligopeptide transport system substrate-binding protein